MNVILKKNGELVLNAAGEPLEGPEANLDELVMMLADPQDGNTIVYDGTNKVWKCGSGGSSGGGVLVCHMGENNTLDKTWKEITDAGFAVVNKPVSEANYNVKSLAEVVIQDGAYVVGFSSGSAKDYFVTDSENGYPVLYEI